MFGAAPTGTHVFRFVSANVQGVASQPNSNGVTVSGIEARLADGTQYLFPAAELTFLSPFGAGAADHNWNQGTVRLATIIANGTSLFSVATNQPLHELITIFGVTPSAVAGGYTFGVDVYRDDVLVSGHDSASFTVANNDENYDHLSSTHRVSHFMAVACTGVSPVISEVRARYGETRAIVGAYDAREIIDVVVVAAHDAGLSGAATLFDGEIELHPTDSLIITDDVDPEVSRVLFYMHVPKNVVPTSSEIWAVGLDSASMYTSAGLPGDAGNIALWAPLSAPVYITALCVVRGFFDILEDNFDGRLVRMGGQRRSVLCLRIQHKNRR